jgi:pSer/pThr/pTyr-binding forkhead associated (FHA) protein
MAYLVIVAMEREPFRQKLLAPAVTIGRAIGCEIWIDDARLSRRHCKLELARGQWVVVDLQSTNGTWLQGNRIEQHPLRDGESFEAGSTRFVFHDAEILSRARDPIEASRLRKMTSADASSETILIPPTQLNGRPAPLPMPRRDRDA